MDLEYSPNILIVDDNEENLLTLKSNLRKLNARIIMAQSGKEAILHTKQRSYALIILDVQMPEMDGYETAEFIRKERMNMHTPIIFLTAVYFDQSNIIKGYQSGSVDYITKPFNREILLSKVKIFLDLDKAKSELIRAKINYENVVQDQTDLICRTDNNFTVKFANQTFLHAFSTSIELIKSKSVMDNIPEFDREKISRALLLLTPNNPIIKLNHSLNVAGGRRLSVSTVFRTLYDENYKHVGYQLVIRDYTRELQIREEVLNAKNKAEEAAKSTSLLLANLGHDLKTPLNSIIGMIQVLMESHLDQDQHEDMQVIQNSGNKLFTLLNSLNEYTSIGAEKIILESTWAEPKSELSNLIGLLEDKIKAKGNKITFKTGKDIPTKIKSDPKRINQILTHLILCANTFLENGTISFSLEKENDDVNHSNFNYTIIIPETGLLNGVSKMILGFLDWGDPSISQEYGEFALGLAVSKGLAELMGGSVNFENTTKNGAAFTFKINLETEKSKSSNAFSVLVVDDNILNQKVVGTSLKKRGFVYDLASDGQTALNKFKQNRFDFILMDIQMPLMDGYETTRLIRDFEKETKTLKPARIYALTANATDEDRKNGLNAGMDGFITKPFKFPELESIISKIAQQK